MKTTLRRVLQICACAEKLYRQNIEDCGTEGAVEEADVLIQDLKSFTALIAHIKDDYNLDGEFSCNQFSLVFDKEEVELILGAFRDVRADMKATVNELNTELDYWSCFFGDSGVN